MTDDDLLLDVSDYIKMYEAQKQKAFLSDTPHDFENAPCWQPLPPLPKKG